MTIDKAVQDAIEAAVSRGISNHEENLPHNENYNDSWEPDRHEIERILLLLIEHAENCPAGCDTELSRIGTKIRLNGLN